MGRTSWRRAFQPCIPFAATDGNDIAGIRLPGVSLPLATYQTARLASGDPRSSCAFPRTNGYERRVSRGVKTHAVPNPATTATRLPSSPTTIPRDAAQRRLSDAIKCASQVVGMSVRQARGRVPITLLPRMEDI